MQLHNVYTVADWHNNEPDRETAIIFTSYEQATLEADQHDDRLK